MDMRKLMGHEKRRGDGYKLLAACFYHPQKELFSQEALFKNLTSALKQVCPEAAPFSEKMREAILQYNDEELAVEYARLFVGPYKLLAPPYGSLYLDQVRRVMNHSTMEVLEMYRQAGLVMADEFKELPDHAAVELEFMYYLIYKEVEALAKADLDTALYFLRNQELFLKKFLGPWIPPFCQKIREGTENEFYIALAECLSTFVSNCRAPANLNYFPKEKTPKATRC